jgi:hypothetical protein
MTSEPTTAPDEPQETATDMSDCVVAAQNGAMGRGRDG